MSRSATARNPGGGTPPIEERKVADVTAVEQAMTLLEQTCDNAASDMQQLMQRRHQHTLDAFGEQMSQGAMQAILRRVRAQQAMSNVLLGHQAQAISELQDIAAT